MTRDKKGPDATLGTVSEDTERPLGDIKVYMYYFTAAGKLNTAASIGLISLFAFFSRFPGTSP